MIKVGTVDPQAVKQAGGEVLPNNMGVTVGGWRIESCKAPISNDAEIEAAKTSLHVMSIPEQYFGNNALTLTHLATGTTLKFTAFDALKAWNTDTSDRIRVDLSEEWLVSRKKEVETHKPQQIEYDWTFTTNYAGTVCGEKNSGNGEANIPNNNNIDPEVDTTEEDATLNSNNTLKWQPTTEQIDLSMLTSRDPILYFDDVPLYESELEDHGSSRFSVKIRVMPRCWYVLARFYLRVDRVAIRLREARIFCRFDNDLTNNKPAAVILRRITHQEGMFEELRRNGAPPEGPAYTDGDAASAALQAVAPIGLKLLEMQLLRHC